MVEWNDKFINKHICLNIKTSMVVSTKIANTISTKFWGQPWYGNNSLSLGNSIIVT